MTWWTVALVAYLLIATLGWCVCASGGRADEAMGYD